MEMLEKISYLGHELTSSKFALLKEPKGKGYYKYGVSIGDKFEFNEILNDEDVHIHNEITISIFSFVHGLEKDTENEVFQLDIEFLIRFELEKDNYIEKHHALDYEWFFMNFAGIASKSITDTLLSHTALKGTFIPAHRLSDS
ncbi:TPA: hypothetical protein ACX6O7_004111 [Photobacterium damselae]